MELNKLREKAGGRAGEGIWLFGAAVYVISLHYNIFLFNSPSSLLTKLEWYGICAGLLAASALLLGKIYLLDRHDIKELLWITALLAATGAGMLATGVRYLWRMALLACAAKGLDMRKLCRMYCCLLLALLAAGTVVFALGFAPDMTKPRDGAEIGHSWGFTHPNVLAYWCMMICFSAILGFGRKVELKLGICAVCLVLTVGVYKLTDSRAVLIAGGLAAACCAVSFLTRKLLNKINRMPALSVGLVLALIAVMMALTALYSPDRPWMVKLNYFFSARLAYAQSAFKTNGITLFGMKEYPYVVDMLYAYVPIKLGILPGLGMLGLMLASVWRTAKAKQWDLLAIALVLALFSTMETAMVFPIYITQLAAFADLKE